MKNPKNSNLSALYSGETMADLLENGYSGHWKFAWWRVKKADYLLVVANKNDNPDHTHRHGEAFCLLNIAKDQQGNNKVTEIKTKDGKKRKRIYFDKYANISAKNAWANLQKGQFPVAHYDRGNNLTAQDAFDLLGLDFDSLVWETLPPKDKQQENVAQNNIEKLRDGIVPQAIDQAKIFIFEKTGIPTQNITISITSFEQ